MAAIDLSKKFPHLRPGGEPPTMFRVNGCGVSLYGSRDHDAETNTYVATWCLALVFLPVLCLRAYRVMRDPASGGWYFLGREPLSGFAKTWNAVLVAGVFALFGSLAFTHYTSSPEYVARKYLKTAGEVADRGQIADAAEMYQVLAVSGGPSADDASAALAALLHDQCQQAPLKECAGVYAAAARVARRRQSPPPQQVADKGLKLVTARGASDPASALAVLDAVRPLVRDTRPLDAQRLPLLQKLAAAEPSKLDVIVPLASLLAQQDKLDEAKKLLLPVKDRLGDGDGARVLGAILGREGDYDGAYALLWPYVKARLDQLHAAEQNWTNTVERLQRVELDLLQQDKGPREFYARHEAASEDGQRALVSE